jgi:adenine-specific DNA-methyltransferase
LVSEVAMSENAVKVEKVARESAGVVGHQIEQLRRLFPEVVSEGKVDWERLLATLGEGVAEGRERFSFTWAGKQDAIACLQQPSRATLVPCPGESVHGDATRHLFIEGENLEVLKLLFKPYFGRVKLIYIDPPYNTGQDFVYPDNFADPLASYLQMTGQADAEGHLTTSEAEAGGRIHSRWLSMMYPRLFLARQLLREDGVICVSIDDHEVHHLRMVMNEVFGEENFVATVIWQKVYSPKNTAKHFSEDHDYIVIYARASETWRPTLLPRSEEANARYDNPDNDPRGDWKPGDMTARNYYADGQYEVTSPSGKKSTPPRGRYWVVNRERFGELIADKRIWWGENGDNMPALKRFLTEVKQGMVPQTLWLYDDVGHTQEAKKELLQFVEYQDTDNVLDTVKPTRLLKRVVHFCTTPTGSDIVLDFFAGSCSTAHAVLLQNHEDGGNRQFICVQLPEKLPKPESVLKLLTDVGKQRIQNVIDRLKADANGKFDFSKGNEQEDLGFKVFKLAKSNYRPWKGRKTEDVDQYVGSLLDHIDPLVSGWKPENVIWEVAIKEGYGLNARIEPIPAGAPNTVYRVTDPDKEQSFLICLDDAVSVDVTKRLELGEGDLFVCRDVALDDTAAANLALQCRLKTI